MTNQVIPAQAVEAAAEVVARCEGYGWDEYREVALEILEAAAPHMLKSAYDLGFQHGSNEPANPYRATK